MQRRNFLKRAVVGTVGAVLLGSQKNSFSMLQDSMEKTTEKTLRPVRLGGPVFFSDADPEEWAAYARTLYRAVYAPNVALDDRDRIAAIRDAVARHDLVIAEVGRWCNLLDADSAKRAENLKVVTEGLALADELGARCCVNIAGSFNKDNWAGPHPKNVSDEFFDLTVENARKIIDGAKPKEAKFALEMMGWAIPDSPDSYLRLIKAIDRKEFGVHVDVCNMINSPQKFWNTTGLIRETFEKLGPWMCSAHAKDLKWMPEMNVYFKECVIGEGEIDIATYLQCLASLSGPDVPLMIEHMSSEQEYTQSRQHLQQVCRENNIPYEYV